MNIKIISKLCGLFSLFIGVNMFLPFLWAIHFEESTGGFLLSIAICLSVGLALLFFGYSANNKLLKKEALAMVSISWFIAAGLGALPFYFSGYFNNFIDCYFESMSGFTTTGASILIDIEALPKSILFWRSYTHWLGGMGIVVLFIAVVPFFSSIGKKIFKSEVPGPFKEGFSPKIKDTALILTGIYIFVTLLEFGLLCLGGMSIYESLCTTFGTIATGGFSTQNLSMAYYDSAYIQIVVTVFMVIAGINFALFFGIFKGKIREIFTNTELKCYLALMLFASIIIGINCFSHGMFNSITEGIRIIVFQVVSIQTTTGYVLSDFETWPYFSQIILIILMFVGGSAGSTAGGVKVMRFIILFKFTIREIAHYFSPRYKGAITVGKGRIDSDVGSLVLAYFVMVISIYITASVLLSLTGLDMVTSLTSVAATINNIGPGLGDVGPLDNYAAISPYGKLILIFCMILGRLEYLAVMILFLPILWKRFS